MEKQESRLRAIIRLQGLTFEKLCLSFFWFGIFYFICILIYRFLRPSFQPLCQLFSTLTVLSYFSFLIKGIAEVTNFLCGIDISIIISLASITIGGLLNTYLTRQEEKKLGELKFLPTKEAAKKFCEYYPQAEKEGWHYKLIEIAKERKEELLNIALEIKDKELVELLSKVSGVEGDSRFEFLKSYFEEEKDWKKLCTNLPKWLEELERKEQWRKAIYDAAAECAAVPTVDDLPTVDVLWEEWFKLRSGHELLRTPSVWEKLPEDKKQLLEPIEIPWPTEKERTENPDILRWCKAVGLKFNPFGPEYAEEDPSLNKYYVFPDFWDKFLLPSPALVLGPEGSGKSALGLYLAHHLRKNHRNFQDKTLAVLMPIIEPVPEALPFSIGEALAMRTLELVAHNPFAFLGAPMSQKGPLIRLWLSFIPNIRTELVANGLGGELLSSIAEEVEKLGPVARIYGISFPTLIELLSPLTPLLGEFHSIYLVADLKPSHLKARDLILWLKMWVSLTPSLLGAGFYPKILCVNPFSIIPYDLARISGWEWGVFVLDWDEAKLVKMVEERIRAAGGASFDQFCKSPLRGVAEKMAKAAKGSPRKLIRLGNEILQRAAEHLDDPYITDEDLRGILP